MATATSSLHTSHQTPFDQWRLSGETVGTFLGHLSVRESICDTRNEGKVGRNGPSAAARPGLHHAQNRHRGRCQLVSVLALWLLPAGKSFTRQLALRAQVFDAAIRLILAKRKVRILCDLLLVSFCHVLKGCP